MRKTIFTAMIATYCCCMGQSLITDIPTIYISTENNQGIYDKENYVPGTVTIVSPNPDDEISSKTMGIRGRGNSTWNMAKKPYRIKFDKKINLFNRPAKAKSWVLLANYADKTLMRNGLAFALSEFMEFEFSPTAVYADVVLNNSYQGSYLVSDQMQVGSGRVDIDEMDATCIEGENLTGGYFMEIDGFGGSEPVHFTTPRGLIITLKSPDEDVVQTVQLNYIKTFINNFENKLFATDFDNPDTGFKSLVDEKSLVDWYICCELTGNSDSFWSTYIYKKRSDNHLYFGPLWDYDIAFNNDNRLGDAINRLMRDSAHDPRTWIARMWRAEWFRKAVYSRWHEIIDAGVEQYLIDYIDTTEAYLKQSQSRNFSKWNNLNSRVYLEQFLFPTYDEGVDYLRQYVHNRIKFLSSSFAHSVSDMTVGDLQKGEKYYMVHYTGLYATPESSNFYIENDGKENQVLRLISSGTDGVWCLQTYDGKYVCARTSDKYCEYTSNPADKRAQFTIADSTHPGFFTLRNLSTGKYLGVEHIAHMSRISTNRSGSDINDAWYLEPVNQTGIVSTTADNKAMKFDATNRSLLAPDFTPIDIYALDGRLIIHSDQTIAIDLTGLSLGVYIASSPIYQPIKFVVK